MPSSGIATIHTLRCFHILCAVPPFLIQAKFSNEINRRYALRASPESQDPIPIQPMPSDIQPIGILPEEGFGKVAGPSPLRAPNGPAGSSLRKDHLRQPVIARIDPGKIARTLQRIHIRTAHRRDTRRLHEPPRRLPAVRIFHVIPDTKRQLFRGKSAVCEDMHGEPRLILRRLWRIRVAVVVDSDRQPGGERAIDMLIKETIQMPSSPAETDDGEGDPARRISSQSIPSLCSDTSMPVLYISSPF